MTSAKVPCLALPMDSWQSAIDALKIRVAVVRIGGVSPDDFRSIIDQFRHNSAFKFSTLHPANGILTQSLGHCQDL